MFRYYIKLGIKHILQTPILSTLILTAIALGIGVSMTILSLYHAMSYNPAGEKSSQLFAVQLAAYGSNVPNWGKHDGLPLQLTHQDAINLRDSSIPVRQSPMYSLSFVLESRFNDAPPTLQFASRAVDRDFFSMFDVEFIYGGPWDKTVDSDPSYTVVINASVNEWAFGGGNNVGQTLAMNETEFTVVGIVETWHPQPNFHDLTIGAYRSKVDAVFIPYSLTPMIKSYPNGNTQGWIYQPIDEFSDLLKSEYTWQQYWVELDIDQDVAAYQQYLASYVEQQSQLGRFQNPNARGHIRNVSEWLTYNEVIDEDNKVMVGLSLLFLLVCMVNTVGLLLAKFLRRINEAGIRRALGANKVQIFQQYLTEVALLGLLGGLLGLVYTLLGLWGLRNLYNQYNSIAHIDMTMMLITVTVSVLASTLTGVYPAYRVCVVQPSIFLKAQ